MKDARAATRRAAGGARKKGGAGTTALPDVGAALADQSVSAEVVTAAPPPVAARPVLMAPADALRGALIDSRQRWRDLVRLACDLAFETDREGRFVFVAPEQTLGWSADWLIGQPSGVLLAADEAGLLDPFRPEAEIRNYRAWLRRSDASLVCLSFHAAPLFDASGALSGARGIGQDVTAQDGSDARVAASLRRGEMLEFVLSRMRSEVLAPRMMQATLEALAGAVGADGAAVVEMPGEGNAPAVLHQVGRDLSVPKHAALQLLLRSSDTTAHGTAHDGRHILASACRTRFGDRAALLLWRSAHGRTWDEDDRAVLESASTLARVVLEHESIQREMTRQARTDPLTGLLNRRALLDEVARRIDRLDREGIPGTLMFIDLDHFKRLNDTRGHDVGDEALCIVAGLLRAAIRPSDLVARLGGDEFALWLDGCDEFAAAERAEALCQDGPSSMGHLCTALGMSIGIATRWPGRGEDLDTLIHRADQVMYEVKRNGRGGWRVSRSDSW